MVVSAQFADVWTAVMGDRVVLTIPAEPRFRSVATLVVGGIGSRADLPYERADDLQLAVLSALDAGIAAQSETEHSIWLPQLLTERGAAFENSNEPARAEGGWPPRRR